MKRVNTLQCKDINSRQLVKYIFNRQMDLGTWVCMWNITAPYTQLPLNLFRAKMRKLIKQGLIDGCTCGCRGDFEVTDAGLTFINTF